MQRRFGAGEAVGVKRRKGQVVRKDHSVQGQRRRRSSMVTPRNTWPLMAKTWLQMVMVEGCSSEFAFSHSQDYQSAQLDFLEAVSTMDPHRISAILQRHPYHVDSLLQLSDVLKMNGDVQAASEFVERALFCFECSFHTLFNFTLGVCRVDYNRFENRGFFLGLFRHIDYIARRGCWRTALELCKLLFSLDPEADPLAMLLQIDHFAIHAGEFAWLKQFGAQLEPSKALSWLPNFSYSLALAELHLAGNGDHDHADTLLQRAIARFPQTVVALAEKCGANLHPSIAQHAFFIPPVNANKSEQSLQALIALYVDRSHALWKPAEMLQWLQVSVGLEVCNGLAAYLLTTYRRCSLG